MLILANNNKPCNIKFSWLQIAIHLAVLFVIDTVWSFLGENVRNGIFITDFETADNLFCMHLDIRNVCLGKKSKCVDNEMNRICDKK